MVVPEIGHDFLELALAVDGAQYLLRLKLLEQGGGRTQSLLSIIGEYLLPRFPLFAPRFGAIFLRVGLALPVRLSGHPEPELAGEQLRSGIPVIDVRDGHAQGRQVRKSRLERRIVYAIGVQLLVDVAREPGPPDPLDIAGAGTVAEPVEDVKDLLVLAQLAGRFFRPCAGSDATTRSRIRPAAKRRTEPVDLKSPVIIFRLIIISPNTIVTTFF
jgi:hypothetical protein